jgi:IS5 family transposase
MLRIHLLQQWYALSDPAMEESLYEIASMRRFARLSLARATIPDETTILNFRHVLEKHSLAERIRETVNKLLVRKGLMLKQGTIVDATIIPAPSSTKNSTGEGDPEVHQSKSSLVMPDIRASRSGKKAPDRRCSGMWRCARESVRRWVTRRSGRSATAASG